MHNSNLSTINEKVLEPNLKVQNPRKESLGEITTIKNLFPIL